MMIMNVVGVLTSIGMETMRLEMALEFWVEGVRLMMMMMMMSSFSD